MLRSEVNDLLDKETRMWFQLHLETKNSKYFHSKATQHYQRNKIEGIRRSEGQWKSDPKGIAEEFIRFYIGLFSTLNDCQPELALDSIRSLMTKYMNRQLIADFTKGKIKVALNQLAPLNSPGPNGMPPLFFQHY